MHNSVINDSYSIAQQGIVNLKSAIYKLLMEANEDGLTNAEIGRSLGIYTGHVRHEGHISRTILAIMESEGVVEQNTATKKWKLKDQTSSNLKDTAGSNE